MKLFVTSRLLQLRREHPGLFTAGEYVPLHAQGERAAHVFAFARRHEGRTAVVVIPRLAAKLESPRRVGGHAADASGPISPTPRRFATCLPVKPSTRRVHRFACRKCSVTSQSACSVGRSREIDHYGVQKRSGRVRLARSCKSDCDLLRLFLCRLDRHDQALGRELLLVKLGPLLVRRQQQGDAGLVGLLRAELGVLLVERRELRDRARSRSRTSFLSSLCSSTFHGGSGCGGFFFGVVFRARFGLVAVEPAPGSFPGSTVSFSLSLSAMTCLQARGHTRARTRARPPRGTPAIISARHPPAQCSTRKSNPRARRAGMYCPRYVRGVAVR